MRCIAFLLLLFPLALSAQEGCELFNLQDLAAENLALHDSIAQFSVDTVILQPDGNLQVLLSNGAIYSIIQGCTDPAFTEYNASANTDDGSCATLPCSDDVEMDGYSYSVVEIGDQCWFAENLRTTAYRNGDAIPAGLTDGDWSSTTSGATAVYGEDDGCNDNSPDIDACDDVQSLAEYGRLYNWYAVDDVRSLCPSGWHVPTDAEWTDLENYITSQGFDGTEGTGLKSTYGWNAFGNGTDYFGFSGLPGGNRVPSNGYFDLAGRGGIWWSSSPSGLLDYAWWRKLWYFNPAFNRNDDDPRYGFSVRCLKD